MATPVPFRQYSHYKKDLSDVFCSFESGIFEKFSTLLKSIANQLDEIKADFTSQPSNRYSARNGNYNVRSNSSVTREESLVNRKSTNP